MAAYAIPKYHHTDICNLNVARYPEPINQFAPSKEHCPRLCPSVLENCLTQPQLGRVGQSSPSRPVVCVFIVVHKEDDYIS